MNEPVNQHTEAERPGLESSHVFREIHEQPQVLQTFLDEEQANVAALAQSIRQRTIRYVLIAARGTSDNAGRYAKYLLGSMNGLPVGLATPSLYTIYQRPPQMQNALVLGISQSGKSPDIVSVLAEARRQGALTAAITNAPDSDLAQEADHVIAQRAGVEQSVAATKTYTTQLAAIALLGALLADDDDMLHALRTVPDAVAQTLALNESNSSAMASAVPTGGVTTGPVAQIVQRYRYMRECVVIGRGYNYASAFELALKLKEMTYTLADPYSSADFLHGPLALVEQGFPVIVFAPAGVMQPEILTFMQTLGQHRVELIVISNHPQTLAQAHVRLGVADGVPEWLSPIPAIVPGQLFAMHLAHIRGYNPDQPRSLSKVTETR